MNKIFRRYLITALVGLVLAGAVFAYQTQQYNIKTDWMTLVSNATFVSGILLLMAGLFCFVSNGGGFDAFAYLGYRMRKAFRKKKNGPDGYFEFVTARREKDKLPLGNLFAVGGVLLVIAIVTAILVV